MGEQTELDELSETKVPFGKYKDMVFDEIPLSYLDWLSGQDWVRSELRQKLSAYLTHPTIMKELAEELDDEDE